MHDHETAEWYQLLRQCGGSAVLAKAVTDPFSYACRLSTGDVVFFESAEVSLNGAYVLLQNIRDYRSPQGDGLKYDAPLFERGLEVRRESIVWIADDPYGS